MAAGAATLDAIDATADLYPTLERRGAQLADALREGAAAAGVPTTVNQVGSMLTVFFTSDAVTDLESASHSDAAAFARWFHGLLDRGVWWPPSGFEAAFLSYALDDDAIADVAAAARAAFAAIGD
jgi:glutamate-1-semialdehyde 2,1-aminomutase